MPLDSPSTRFGSGRSILRVEDEALLKGLGRFADDVDIEGALRLFILRSPHAHARIGAIDTSAAREMPGVQAVLTGADLVAAGVKPLPRSVDFRRAGGAPSEGPPQRALAVDVVRHVGEPVAAVVADSLAQARDAAEAIAIDYTPLPVAIAMSDATKDGAPLVWDKATGNIAAEMRHGDAAAADRAFAAAAHRVSVTLDNQRVIPSPIEPRATLAAFDPATGRVTMTVSCQTPTGLRDDLCNEVLGIPPESVRVVVGDVGGGFGMKTALYPEDVVAAVATRQLQRPVKWTADRSDEFLGASHGRDLFSTVELALDRDGKILALRVHSDANMGAYATPAGVAIQLLIGPWVATSIYDIPTIDILIRAVLTHTAPTGPYRGAGRPEAIYMIERALDAAARQTGLDRVQLRRINMIRPEQMPYTNAMQKKYDTGQFERVLDLGLKHADWDGYPARESASRAKGRWRGRGIVTFIEWTGADVFTEDVTVTIAKDEKGDGLIEIFSATQAMGQGLATTFAQLAVDVFGVPLERIRIALGDTDRGTGFGSAGSRSLFVGGSAVKVASERAVANAQELAAHELEAAASDIEYRDGVFRIAGTDRAIGLFDLSDRQPERRIVFKSTSSVADATWPNGCHVCEVEVDPDTGEVTLDRYWSVNDVGRVVNAMIVRGQLEGGAMQGIGQALCELFAYDPETGQPLSLSYMNYALPLADLTPVFDMTMDEATPSINNPLGVKGVGELGTIGATPCVVNAVLDALAKNGLGTAADALQMPLWPERVWRAIAGARRA